MFGSLPAVDTRVHCDALAGRPAPANRLSPSHCNRYDRLNRRAVRARRHTPGVVRSLAPLQRGRRLFLKHSAIAAAFRGQLLAHAVRGIHRGRVEQRDHCDGQYLEECAHEGEVKVYSSGARLQQIRPDNAGRGVKPGVQDVG